MAKMRAVDAAMYVLEKEGITTAFGVHGAAINPFYSAMRKHGGIRHILARHVEGASHMAEGYTRAAAGNIGVCTGTSGPAGNRHDHRALFRFCRLHPDFMHYRPRHERVCTRKISVQSILKRLQNQSARWQ